MALDPKKGGKIMAKLGHDLLSISQGKKIAAPDQKQAIRDHVRLLKQMGATVRG